MPDIAVLIKPASSLCNMRCKYCFYADVSSRREIRSFGIMSHETSHMLIDKVFGQAKNSEQISFAFQGGEPTLAGLDFFRDFCSYCDEKNNKNLKISYAIQTNGILIDNDFCAFLKKYDFLVGLSLDGDRQMHDFCRVDEKGGTYERVIAASKLLEQHSVRFDLLTVLTRQIADHPKQLWNFLNRNNFGFIQIIPCLPELENDVGHEVYSLTPRKYGRFLKEFFRLWADGIYNSNYISVRHFDNYVRIAMGEYPEMCGMTGRCAIQLVTEADGSVYPCDFYVLDNEKLGNINDSSIDDLKKSQKAELFLKKNAETIGRCENCGYFGRCEGGCRRFRSFLLSESNYCPVRDFLDESKNELAQIAKLVLYRHNM